MISRFNQLFLAFTAVTPLLLSVAIVLSLLHLSEYLEDWARLFNQCIVPDSVYWWIPNILIILFAVSWIWTKVFLNSIMVNKRGKKTITLASLQNKPLNNLLAVIAMLPPWIMLVMKEEMVMTIMVISIIVSLVLAFVISKQGYTSLICLLCGYKVYEGQNINGMKMLLVSKRTWASHKDIHDIVLLSDSFALIVQ